MKQNDEGDNESRRPRRAYEKPRLERCGDVRELTLGGAGSVSDGGFGGLKFGG